MYRFLFRSCVLVLLTLSPGFGAIPAFARGSPNPATSSDSLSAAPSVLITGVYFDPFITGEASEAIQVQITGDKLLSIARWSLSDDHGTVSFPEGSVISPHQKLWVTRTAAAFRKEFGFNPAFEYGSNSDSTVPDMSGTPITLANDGDVVVLKDGLDQVVDAVVYGNASLPETYWHGAGVRPLRIAGGSTEGQILYRKMRESDGLPTSDTDSAADWAQDTEDNSLGKRVQFPGWDIDQFFQTTKAQEYAYVKYCVAPDNLFECYRDEILAARDSIQIETYSLTNARLVDALTQQISAGVHVGVLLDAGALVAQGKWACQQIALKGGQCWLMDSKSEAKIAKRYDNLHAKWIVIDGKRLVAGSENMGDDGMPSDDMSDGTLGTRGGALVTDSPTLVARAQEILSRDLDPLNHLDIRRWGTNTSDYPPLGFVPNYVNGGTAYPVQFPTPFATSGNFSFQLVQCPENCLRQTDALLGLTRQADAGDTLLVEQLYEHKYWGYGASDPSLDPNLRLESYIQAARRGARVQILLDSFYDTFSEARSNYETCRYVNELSPYYSIECRLGNPTGVGLHNKMVLLKHGTRGIVHLGSINGSETSSKLNRELAVQVESAEAYDYWAKVFSYDWSVSTLSPRRIYLPIILRR
jgi:cardiolipin synthase